MNEPLVKIEKGIIVIEFTYRKGSIDDFTSNFRLANNQTCVYDGY